MTPGEIAAIEAHALHAVQEDAVALDEVAVEPERLYACVASVDGVQRVVRARSRWVGSEGAVDVVRFAE